MSDLTPNVQHKTTPVTAYVSSRFERQAAISQSTRRGETRHSFDSQSYPNAFLSLNYSSPKKGARLIEDEWERSTFQIQTDHGSRHTVMVWTCVRRRNIFSPGDTFKFNVAWRPETILVTGSPGRPPPLSHCAWALNGTQLIQVHRTHKDYY